MDDAAFVDAFEDLTLPPAAFDHWGHLRLALLTLARDGFELTAVRLPQAIQRYAAHLGAPEKFHATLTHALLHLLEAERRAQGSERNWEALLEGAPALSQDALALVHRHHSPAQLATASARETIQPPDRAPYP